MQPEKKTLLQKLGIVTSKHAADQVYAALIILALVGAVLLWFMVPGGADQQHPDREIQPLGVET